LPAGENPNKAFHHQVFPAQFISCHSPSSACSPTTRHAAYCHISGHSLMPLCFEQNGFCLLLTLSNATQHTLPCMHSFLTFLLLALGLHNTIGLTHPFVLPICHPSWVVTSPKSQLHLSHPCLPSPLNDLAT
jgi:hypothetical protein